jgi:signal transduction histidine kinase
LNRSRKAAKRLVPEDVATLAAHLQDKLETERATTARRLHGDVAGMLAAARMDLSRLAGRIDDDPDLREQVVRVDQIIESVIHNARTEMQRLHPALLDHFGLPAALRHLVEETCRTSGVEYTLDLSDNADSGAGPVDLAAYRVVESVLDGRTMSRINVRLRESNGARTVLLQVSGADEHTHQARRDLLALRAWLETMGAGWTESVRGEVDEVELTLPRSTPTATACLDPTPAS